MLARARDSPMNMFRIEYETVNHYTRYRVYHGDEFIRMFYYHYAAVCFVRYCNDKLDGD